MKEAVVALALIQFAGILLRATDKKSNSVVGVVADLILITFALTSIGFALFLLYVTLKK